MCLKHIDIAFKWNKPAVISIHRLNFMGGLDVTNFERGLKHLSTLLKEIVKRWPDVEFMASEELGVLIQS